MQRIDRPPLVIRSRTWDRFQSAANEARRRFPARLVQGFDCLGLIMDRKLVNGGYWCTPINSLQFAATGGEGTHFSFLLDGERIDDNTPILATVPNPAEQCNFVVGDSLFDFLCLGCHRGYFGLEQLASDARRTVGAFSSRRWVPETDADWWFGLGVNSDQQPVLDFLRKRLALRPWRNAWSKFCRLQRQHLPRLELRADRYMAESVVDEIKSWNRWAKAN